MELSDKVKALIIKARIMNIQEWDLEENAMTLIQKADDEGRYLTDQDLEQLQRRTPQTLPWLNIVQQIQEQAPSIVDEARSQVLNRFPSINQPGGDLYPPSRAEACWRDFWHFLRCISYGIAGATPNYTSDIGLSYMQKLYQELQVPLDAMILGLEEIKTASLKRLKSEDHLQIAPYFDHLIAKLKAFQTTTNTINRG